MNSQPSSLRLILILGALCTISPLAIDMYLPSFTQMAADFGTTPARVSLSLSSYFVGLACGQLLYGPLLDRFGRKPPLSVGLLVFILCCLGCLAVRSVEWLIALRFVQALGGCSAQVAAMAMVNDFFPFERRARVISLLVLILGVSPLFAPTIGSLLVGSVGWTGIFMAMILIALLLLVACFILLPEGHVADSTVKLHPGSVARDYFAILRIPRFTIYAVSGSFSFAGLFVYVVSSPLIFMDVFQVTTATYGLIFAVLTSGFIIGSQLNLWLAHRFSPARIFRFAQNAQMIVAALFWVVTLFGVQSLPVTMVFLFLILFSTGIVAPNSAVVAMADFTKEAGRVSALLGFVQMSLGACLSSLVGFLDARDLRSVVSVMAISAILAVVIRTRVPKPAPGSAAVEG